MPNSMTNQVEHQPARSRFVLVENGLEAEMTYQQSGDVLVVDHTGVPPPLQHRGLADQLAKAALNYAREHKLQVDPQCRFMAVYLKRHPQAD